MRVVVALMLAGCGRVSFDPRIDGMTNPQPDAAPTSYREAVLADHPVGYWRLADPGPVAKDETGNVDGTYVGSCTFGTPGALAKDPDPAVKFDGSSCRVTLADTFAFIGTSPYTLEAWVSFARTDNFEFVIGKETRNTMAPIDGYLMLESASGVYIERVASSVTSQSQPVAITGGTFYHLATVYDGTMMQLYIDGVAASPPVMSPVALNAYSASTTIGANHDVNVCWLDGVIDEVAIYDHALTQAQLQIHVDIGKNGPP